MAYLLDTNVVLRRIVRNDALHAVVRAALDSLLLAGEELYITPQILMEYRALATRPVAANGLGLPPARASAHIRFIERRFRMAADTPMVYPAWRDLAERYNVEGRQVYDARLVAVMLTHGITHILTLNARHFRRFREIAVVEPADVPL